MKKYILLVFVLFPFVTVHAQVQPVPIEQHKWGGYVGTLDYEPGRPSRVLAGGGNSGLFESLDGGLTWGHIDSLPAWRITYLSFFRADPNIVLLTSNYDTRVIRPSGIWISHDKGRTWSNVCIPLATDPSRCFPIPGAYSISWIPGTSGVLVGTDEGVAINRDIRPGSGAMWSLLGIRGTTYDQKRVYSILALDENNFVANIGSGTFWTDDAGANWSPVRGIPLNSNGSSRALCVTPTDTKILFFYSYYGPLKYSLDKGHTWVSFPGYADGGNQPPFVKATLASPTDRDNFVLYVGDGTYLSRLRLDSSDVSGWTSITPEPLTLSHLDPQDIIFDPDTKKPYVLAGDFGIQIPANEDASSWRSVGGGADGFNGFEITGMAVQATPDTYYEAEIYVSTWHNGVMWSPDAGRSWQDIPGLGEATNLEANGPMVTGSDARISMQQFNGTLRRLGLFLYGRGYSSVSTSLEPLFRQDAPGIYFRYLRKDGRNCILAIKGNDYYLIPQEGGTWRQFYHFTPSLTERDLANGLSISYEADGTPVIYQPYVTVSTTADGEDVRQLKKITVTGTVDAPTSTQVSLSMNNFQSLGRIESYQEKAVFASDPTNPDYLIAADIGTRKMKKSIHGGSDWDDDDSLTALVTDNYRLNFFSVTPDFWPGPQAQGVYFNPYNHLDIYVPTTESGIIVSRDGGATWHRIAGSKQVQLVNSVGFTPGGMVYFGSKARGLWKYDSNRLINFPFDVLTDPRVLIVDPMTGALVPIDGLGPDVCPACRIDILKDGIITNLNFPADSNPTVFVSDPNSIFSFFSEAKGSERPVFSRAVSDSRQRGLPVLAQPGRDAATSQSDPNPVLKQLQMPDRIVKGLITDHGQIKALILTNAKMGKIPSSLFFKNELFADGDKQNATGGPPPMPLPRNIAYKHYRPFVDLVRKVPSPSTTVAQNDLVQLYGSGFEPTRKLKHYVSIWVGSYRVSEKVSVDNTGAFSLQFRVPRQAGRQPITISQKTIYGVLTKIISIQIANTD